MKIAVCFSGQLRTGIESSENIKRYLGFLYNYCDFFIHTWDINTQKHYNTSNIYHLEEKITDKYFNEFIEIYSPKKIEIENYKETFEKESEIINQNLIHYFEKIIPLWYSFMKSVELKKAYEKDHNFEYDLVIKLRPDIIFPESRRLSIELDHYRFLNKNEVYIENLSTNLEMNMRFIDDVFFIANSKTIDKFSKLYIEYIKKLKINILNNSYIPYWEVYNTYNHLIYNNITILKPNLYQEAYTIYRPECIKYSSLTEFKKCRECDGYYYSAPETKKNFNIETLYIDYLRENYNFDENKKYTIDEVLSNKKR